MFDLEDKLELLEDTKRGSVQPV